MNPTQETKPAAIDARFAYGQFSWVDLTTHEMDAVLRFYTDLFGWTADLQDTGGGPPYAMFRLEGDVVAGIGEMPDEVRASGAPPTWNSYVQVDDVHVAADRAGELGATILVPPMQIYDAGWLAYLQDPTGAALGLWQSADFRGADRVNIPGSFCWNELATSDLETAQTFYHRLFGWTYVDHADSEAPYVIIQHDGQDNGGMLQMTDEWKGIPPHWSVYFAVEDIDDSLARLQSLGGAVHHGPFDTSVGRMAVVADPQGATFSLIALKAEA